METDHTETVVDKAVAYVKDFFGVPPSDRTTPDVEAKPEYTDTAPEPTIEGAMRLEPHTRTLKIGAETEGPREDESANSAVDEHIQAAGKLHRAEWSVQKALGEIQDISRDMREKFVEEKNPSYKDEADINSAAETMNDNKKLPPDSEMQEAVERARDANSKEKSRQAEQESDWRLPVL
jgi:hypothetical protein